jgi:hypothetical protein
MGPTRLNSVNQHWIRLSTADQDQDIDTLHTWMKLTGKRIWPSFTRAIEKEKTKATYWKHI